MCDLLITLHLICGASIWHVVIIVLILAADAWASTGSSEWKKLDSSLTFLGAYMLLICP